MLSQPARAQLLSRSSKAWVTSWAMETQRDRDNNSLQSIKSSCQSTREQHGVASEKNKTKQNKTKLWQTRTIQATQNQTLCSSRLLSFLSPRNMVPIFSFFPLLLLLLLLLLTRLLLNLTSLAQQKKGVTQQSEQLKHRQPP